MDDKPITNEVEEAMALLHGEPVVEFERPAKQIIETEDGYEEAERLGWVKFSAAFRKKMLARLKGAKLAVFLCICLHVNENGESFPGIETIAKETGYHRETVMLEIAELEKIPGLLTVIRSQGRSNRYRPMYVARGVGKEPVEKIRPVGISDPSDLAAEPVEETPTGFDQTSRGNPDSKKKEEFKKKGDLVDAVLHYSNPKEVAERSAVEAFEKAFGVNGWPWWSNTAWDKFRRFVTKIYQEEPTAFRQYVAWRGGTGRFTAMSNKQIRQQPQMFMDTGWPDFTASRQPSDDVYAGNKAFLI